MEIVSLEKLPQRADIKDVPTDDPAAVYNVCLALRELCDRENGLGVSAVQAGIPWRLFIVKGDDRCPLVKAGEYGYFANCSYSPVGTSEVLSMEGCLSLRDADGRLRSFRVKRPYEIRLVGLRLTEGLRFEPFEASLTARQCGIVFQHETDHNLGHDGLVSVTGEEVLLW